MLPKWLEGPKWLELPEWREGPEGPEQPRWPERPKWLECRGEMESDRRGWSRNVVSSEFDADVRAVNQRVVLAQPA